MLIFYVNEKQKNHSRLIRNLFRSYPGDKILQPSSRFDRNMKLNERATMIVFAGIIRGEGLIYKWCVEHKKDFLYLDHAYLNRGYNERFPHLEWMRITKNAFTWTKNEYQTSARWRKHMGPLFPLQPWCGNNRKNILVLPPSAASKFLFPDAEYWMEQTLAELKKYTDAPFIVREKPEQPQINPITNEILGRIKYKHERKIEEEIADAKCIVSFNSAVPVLGTIAGVPTICSPEAAAYPMSIHPSEIENPPEPDRQAWLNQLIHHQFTTSELIDGSVWGYLKKQDDPK